MCRGCGVTTAESPPPAIFAFECGATEEGGGRNERGVVPAGKAKSAESPQWSGVAPRSVSGDEDDSTSSQENTSASRTGTTRNSRGSSFLLPSLEAAVAQLLLAYHASCSERRSSTSPQLQQQQQRQQQQHPLGRTDRLGEATGTSTAAAAASLESHSSEGKTAGGFHHQPEQQEDSPAGLWSATDRFALPSCPATTPRGADVETATAPQPVGEFLALGSTPQPQADDEKALPAASLLAIQQEPSPLGIIIKNGQHAVEPQRDSMLNFCCSSSYRADGDCPRRPIPDADDEETNLGEGEFAAGAVAGAATPAAPAVVYGSTGLNCRLLHRPPAAADCDNDAKHSAPNLCQQLLLLAPPTSTSVEEGRKMDELSSPAQQQPFAAAFGRQACRPSPQTKFVAGGTPAEVSPVTTAANANVATPTVAAQMASAATVPTIACKSHRESYATHNNLHLHSRYEGEFAAVLPAAAASVASVAVDPEEEQRATSQRQQQNDTNYRHHHHRRGGGGHCSRSNSVVVDFSHFASHPLARAEVPVAPGDLSLLSVRALPAPLTAVARTAAPAASRGSTAAPAASTGSVAAPATTGGRGRHAQQLLVPVVNAMARQEVERWLTSCAFPSVREMQFLVSAFLKLWGDKLSTAQLRQLHYVLVAVPKHHLHAWLSGSAPLPTRRLAPPGSFLEDSPARHDRGDVEERLHERTIEQRGGAAAATQAAPPATAFPCSQSGTPPRQQHLAATALDRTAEQRAGESPASSASSASSSSSSLKAGAGTTARRVTGVAAAAAAGRGGGGASEACNNTDAWNVEFVAGNLLLAFINLRHPNLAWFASSKRGLRWMSCRAGPSSSLVARGRCSSRWSSKKDYYRDYSSNSEGRQRRRSASQ